MKRTYSIGKRFTAMLLCICMIVACLPNITLPVTAIGTEDMTNKVVDPSTIDGWEQYFGSNVMSTEYTGGVWTDKSVFQSFADYQTAEGVQNFVTPTGSAIPNSVKQMLATDPENFLIALSAITANKSVSGSSSTPLDTMLVLDVSGSMQGNNAVAMVQATNQAIETLLKQNTNNRVGVVLYSGNHELGNSATSTASVLLPLGRYTTTNTMDVGDNQTIPAYLTISGSGNNQTVSVASSVNNGNSADSKTVRGGTYIQNGLYQAWEEFASVTDTKVPEGQVQAGAQRTPVIVLMSDGAPTAATTGYNDVQTSNLGNGGSTDNRIAFMTQLTAAWVRSKIGTHYNTTPLFYTLGVGTGNSSEATSVLNPAGSTQTLNTYWTRFLDGTDGQNVRITTGNNSWSVYKDANVKEKVYVDKYWLASNSSSLIDAFKQIVNSIVLQAEQHSTLVEAEQGADMSGFVTFEDELGELMQVKAVKGLVIGDVIFTGAELAKGFTEENMGTVDDPKEYGNEFIRTIKERLGITDTAVAQQLAINAYNAGQLSYTSGTEYRNYIGWYADADGNYLGFWQESDGYGANAALPNATYINRSYGYLGAESSEENASDMMHVVVMVRTEIATGHQTVVYKIPASLIPTVTYNVELNGSDPSSVKSITRDAAEPTRLLVEVGLRSDINAINLEEKIAEHVAKGGHVHENADGTYTFYTNQWGDGDGGEVNYDEPLTHLTTESHFHPALENERYYHVSDTLVYSDTSGTVYTGTTAPSGTGYYYARTYYESVNGTAQRTTEYVPLAAVSVAQAVQGAAGWYVPAGTPQQLTRFANSKTQNTTGTLNYSWNPVTLHNENGYNAYSFLGNNGSFTIEPAQGIALSKTVTETVEGAPTEFTFTVTLSQSVANPTVTDADGAAISSENWSVSGSKITVKLSAGQTVYITGIPAGTTYTVEEAANDYYAASSSNASGTITAYTINPVDFTNTPRGYGDLIVSKDVTHPFDVVPDALTNKQFTINVTLSGVNVANKTFQVTGLAGTTSVTTDANGTFSVKLRDGESLTVKGLPEGTVYSTTETLSATADKGFAMDEANSQLTGQIVKDAAVEAHVVNNYAPAEPAASITVSGTKTVDDVAGTFDWTGKVFTFKLEQYHPEVGHYTQIGNTAVVTRPGGTYSFTDALKFNAIGTYYYKVSEVIPAEADRLEGMSYDASAGRFVVYVTDNDVDGEMELEIRDYTTGEVINGSNNVFTFTKNFVNTHTTDATYVEFTVDKTVTDPHGIGVSEAGFLFGLFKVENGVVAAEPSYTMRTTLLDDTQDGKATFHIPLTQVGETTYILKEIKPAERQLIPGMVYDTTEYTVIVSAEAEDGKLVPGVEFKKGDSAISESDLVFNNEVKLDPTSVQWAVNKIMAGITPPTAEEFTFTLTETDGSFVTVKEGGVTDSVTIAGAGSNRFTVIDYNKVGTHYYVIRETAGSRGGMTYDPTVYHVTVNVTASGNDLVAATTISKLGGGTVADITFTNTYAITGTAETVISGIKYLEGRELLAGEFEFGLYEGSGLLQSVKNRTNGTFDFAPITYTADDIGSHTYTVREIVPTTKLGGVTYDETTAYTVVVTVADNGQGGLTVTKTGDTAIEFTNTYKAASTSATISGTKTLYGVDSGTYLDLANGQFTFELYISDSNFATQGTMVETTNAADGSFSFKLDYTAASDNYYILRERIDEAAGMAYDAGRYFIRVLVSDNGQGQLYPTVSMTREGIGAASAIIFGNRYDPEPTTATISGTKALTGRDIVDGEFTFELYEGTQLLQTAENVGKDFSFAAIEYTKPDTYTYTVKERIPADADNNQYKGVTYDTTSYTVTVNVIDNNGVLEATVSYSAAQLVFNNTYDGADTHFSVSGTKELMGNKTLTEGMFTFEMYDKNGVHIATTANEADGSFSFQNIPLAEAGDYTFTVKEKIPTEAMKKNGLWIYQGISYSEEVYTVTVKVTDNGQGNLVAETPVIVDGPMNFINGYSVDPIQVTIHGVKELTGRTLKAGEFTFLLDAGQDGTQQAANKADGSITFDPITYYTAGTYTYNISENKGSLGGVDYDENSYTVTVEVTDNGDGTLSADVQYPNSTLKFVNTYTISGDTSFTVEGTKVLDGRDLTSQDVFTFEMKDSSGKTVATADTVDGKFSFTDVKLSSLGRHVFTVTEKVPEGADGRVKDGITYTDAVYHVVVNVTDKGDGTMAAGTPICYVNGIDSTTMEFTNTYKVTKGTTTDIVGKKVLNGNKTLEAGMYTFELYAGTDTTAEPIDSVTNAANGTVRFEDVALETLGTNTFTVKELAPEGGKLDGVTYSTLVYTVTVETTDNGKGGMTAGEPVYSLGDVQQTAMEFINTYAVEGSVTVEIPGKKVLTGGKKLTGNMFSFALYAGTDTTAEPLAIVQNAEDGSFRFTEILLETVGEHTFTVVELSPEGGEKDGVKYSDLVCTVTVETKDNGKGGMTVEAPVYYHGTTAIEAIEFVNVYTPVDIAVDLGIKKTVKIESGEDIGPAGFKFQMSDEAGKTYDVESDKDGNAKFQVKFSGKDAGKTFAYTITEVNTKRTGVTYSNAKYTVTITVGQNDAGELIPTVKLDGKTVDSVAVEFINTYDASEIPVTGDEFSAVLFISLMAISGLGLVAVIVAKKKSSAK